MSQRARVRIESDKIVLQMEYNRKAIAVLKEIIPGDLREYNPQTNTWFISRNMRSEVEKVLEDFYQEVNGEEIRVWKERRDDTTRAV